MSEKQQMRTPSGMGGLVKYDEGKGGIKLKPEWIIGACGFLVIVEIALYMMVHV